IENVRWKIKPAALTVSAPSEVKKAYDGTANATVTPIFNGLQGGDNLTAADYSVTAAFKDAKVGYKKIVTGQVTLNQTATAKNYVLRDDGKFSTDNGTIAKAAAPTVQPVELTIYNGVQDDYFVDLPPLPDLNEGKSYGKVDYSDNHTITLPEGYTAQSAVVADPENLDTYRLLLHMKQTGSRTGEIGTVTIPVTTSNYQDIILTVGSGDNPVGCHYTNGTYGSVTAAAASFQHCSWLNHFRRSPTSSSYNSTAVPPAQAADWLRWAIICLPKPRQLCRSTKIHRAQSCAGQGLCRCAERANGRKSCWTARKSHRFLHRDGQHRHRPGDTH
ncbi:MAG: YDG domain-containing protein, partial [Gemmiger formicilis]|uniref:YDG domain-containing protein n=1 Tax=Gemmiger formicilis TaxID=745368 RepID=UPI003994C782